MSKRLLLYLIFVIGLLCNVSKVSAAKVIHDDLSAATNPTQHVRYFEDTASVFTYEQILALDTSEFTTTTANNLNFVRSKSKFWIVFDIENRTDEKLTLLVKNPLINYLNAYVIDEEGETSTVTTGGYTAYATRSFTTSQFSFDLGLHPSKVILETNTMTDFYFPMSIMGREILIETLHHTDLLNGFLVGILIGLFFYNLFLFISIRDKSSFWYLVYVFCLSLILLRIRGIGFEILWPEAPYMNGGTSIPFALLVISSSVFTNYFLEVKSYSRFLSVYLWLHTAFSCGLLIYAVLFSEYITANIFLYFQGTILGFSELLIAAYVWYRGNKIAPYFIFAWGFAIIFAPITTAAVNGLLPGSFITLNLSQLLYSLKVILMSNVLGFKYNFFKKDALAKAEENRVILENQNVTLEKKVIERTIELKETNTQLEQVNQMKDRIFAIIGHDLRKPVVAFNGISETINYLVKKEDYSTLQQLGAEIEKDGFALQKLTDNLLNWALMQRDVMPYNPQEVNLSEKAEEIILIFEKVARDKNIGLLNKIPKGMRVFVDPNALLTILMNLVDNALKYTPVGGLVELGAVSEAEGVKILVSDTGVGMSEEQMRDIFLLQKDKSQKGTSGEKGTGLGLHLVNELVKLNKGIIKAESSRGHGTAFEVLLPAKSLEVA